MTVRQLISMLEQLDEDKDIFVAIMNGDSGQIHVAPVTESCDDETVIGYVITDKSLDVQ